MRRTSNTNTVKTGSNRRRISKRAAHPSISIEKLHKNLDALHAEAERGDYQAQFRLETVSKLVDPCLTFCESDVQRARNKGYPPQVERGLKLYRMMSRLMVLCEPVGDAIGAAGRVRLINFEGLTWSEFLDLKGNASGLVHRLSDKHTTSEQFNGLELLKPDERELYERAKRYFGGRKRPTLKSLALGLLAEEGEVYVDRSGFNHLAAVREFREIHKDELGWGWYFVGGVDSYNKNPMSAREFYVEGMASLRKAMHGLVIPDYSKALGQAVFGMSQQILRSQEWMKEIVKGLPKMLEGVETARKAFAAAIHSDMRMPRIDLSKMFFMDGFIEGKK
jgi:hypothetical protein